jgi:hypothetical protein
LLVWAVLMLYLLPARLGRRREVISPGALLFINLVFGWTVIGWAICLIWAVVGATKAQDEFYRQKWTNRP